MPLFIGLMSGTSVDAIDAALVRISTKSPGRYAAKVLHHTEHPWPKKLRDRLLAIMAPASTTTQELCQLNTLVSYHFAQAVEKLLAQSHTPRTKITALASHGQTICHLPPSPNLRTRESANRRSPTLAQSPLRRFADSSPFPSTLQIGDPSVLSTLTQIPTIANFRPADIALGGQAHPLVPWTDAALLSHPTKSRCIQNIGGIANVTYLPKAQRHKGTKALRDQNGIRTNAPAPLSASVPQCLGAFPHVIAFDTGPGNMLMDALISLATNGKKRYDANGRLAAKGTLDPVLLAKLQSLPYFTQPPPKSTGRELFGQHLAQQLLSTKHLALSTLLATATRLTAWSIAHAYARFLPTLPDEVILCGGGADNPTLTRMLSEELALLPTRPKRARSVSAGPSTSPHPGSSFAQANQSASKKILLSRIDDYGIPNKAKEAASFALLAAATLDGIPANLPSVTGASRPTLLGVIAPQPRP